MKKFAKLSAVFAALVLALSCFVACSNGDDDSASVQALQGLWIQDDDSGFYFENNICYYVWLENNIWYYNSKGKFSVSGNKIRLYNDEGTEYDEADFSINGNKLTLKTEGEEDVWIKSNKTPNLQYYTDN
ncbi:MAG: lipocalin family protein [Treponemataceae bacterium]|nr:lipocalin family protein [Treponemataceae bacterium]